MITGQPSRQPSRQPTREPSRQPSSQPSRQPSRQPTAKPSRQPTSQPSAQPIMRPTGMILLMFPCCSTSFYNTPFPTSYRSLLFAILSYFWFLFSFQAFMTLLH